MPRQKRALYDSGLHVPLIIRFPGTWRAGEIDERLISFVDFLPTLVSMIGEKSPLHVHGQAFEGRYRARVNRRYIHAASDRLDEYYESVRAVRSRRYKYLRNLKPEIGYYLPLSYREQMSTMQELLRMRAAGTLDSVQSLWFRSTRPAEELFDTELDPHEILDVAGDPAYATVLAEHRAEYDRWAETIPDFGLLPESEYIELIWPDRVQPHTARPEGSWEGVRLDLTCVTPGALIGYRDAVPSSSTNTPWYIYDRPLRVEAGTRIVAQAHRIGYRPSARSIFDNAGSDE